MVAARSAWLGLLLLLLLAGCAAERPLLTRSERFLPPFPDEPVYVVPFLAVMVPPEIEQGIFDRLVDNLNASAGGREFIIVKRGREPEGKAWLADKHYLEGEIFGFRQDSGCCSTELRLQARITYHQPGEETPTLVAAFPRLILFDHDRSTLELEKERLIAESAQNLALAIAPLFVPPPQVP